jgi:Berberine and berberine like
MATIVALWPPPAGPRQPHYAWVRGLWDGLRSCSAGAGYVNHLEADEGHDRVRQAYGEPTYQRLVEVKNR